MIEFDDLSTFYDSSGRLIHETCVETTTYTGGRSIYYMGVGTTAAFALGGVATVVMALAGAYAIYYLGEYLDEKWSEFKKTLFE